MKRDLKRFLDQFRVLSISKNAIYIWLIYVGRVVHDLSDLYSVLSDDEVLRACRFRFEKDRLQFIVGRGMLRFILSQHSGVSPRSLQFSYGKFGKPEQGNSDLTFNLSHSNGSVLLAVTRSRRIGIDIEEIRSSSNLNAMGDFIFSPEEKEAWQALPESLQLSAFYDIWTCKEAFGKALDCGLSYALKEIVLGTSLGKNVKLKKFMHVDVHSGEKSCWTIQSLNLHPNLKAALVSEGPEWPSLVYRYDFAN